MLNYILWIKRMTFPNVLAIIKFKKYICVSNIILFINMYLLSQELSKLWYLICDIFPSTAS